MEEEEGGCRSQPASLRADSYSTAHWAASRAVVSWAIVPRRSANEMFFLTCPRERSKLRIVQTTVLTYLPHPFLQRLVESSLPRAPLGRGGKIPVLGAGGWKRFPGRHEIHRSLARSLASSLSRHVARRARALGVGLRGRSPARAEQGGEAARLAEADQQQHSERAVRTRKQQSRLPMPDKRLRTAQEQLLRGACPGWRCVRHPVPWLQRRGWAAPVRQSREPASSRRGACSRGRRRRCQRGKCRRRRDEIFLKIGGKPRDPRAPLFHTLELGEQMATNWVGALNI